MSGRGPGGRGGRGAWRGRGGRGAALTVKDEEGTVIDLQPNGPPLTYPETELPNHAEVSARDQVLLMRRQELVAALKKSPFVLEAKDDKTEDVDTLMDAYMVKPTTEGPLPPLRGPGAAGSRKRAREPLTSVIKLLPEYFPEELYSSTDRKYARLQDTYFKRSAAKKSDFGLHRLDALEQLERSAAGEKEGEKEGEGEGEAEAEVVDEDDEEDMNEDDYYQGADFDDDEEYDAGFDDGGDDHGTF